MPAGRLSKQWNGSGSRALCYRHSGWVTIVPTQPTPFQATARCGGSWRPFLPSFNLTFPANGQPGVNSTALIATRNSPHQRWTLPSRHPSPLKNPTAFPPPFFPLSLSLSPFFSHSLRLSPSYTARFPPRSTLVRLRNSPRNDYFSSVTLRLTCSWKSSKIKRSINERGRNGREIEIARLIIENVFSFS